MYRVMLSYPLFGSGMRRLEQETDLFVTGCGELAPYEAQFLQADAFITRNVHPDKALIAKMSSTDLKSCRSIALKRKSVTRTRWCVMSWNSFSAARMQT